MLWCKLNCFVSSGCPALGCLGSAPQESRSHTPGPRFAWLCRLGLLSHHTPHPSPCVVGEEGDAKQGSAFTSFQSVRPSRKVCLEGYQLPSTVSSYIPFPLFMLWGYWLYVVWFPVPVTSQRQVPCLQSLNIRPQALPNVGRTQVLVSFHGIKFPRLFFPLSPRSSSSPPKFSPVPITLQPSSVAVMTHGGKASCAR